MFHLVAQADLVIGLRPDNVTGVLPAGDTDLKTLLLRSTANVASMLAFSSNADAVLSISSLRNTSASLVLQRGGVRGWEVC